MEEAVGALGGEEAVSALDNTHNRAEEVDHGVLWTALPRGRGGGFLRAWRQSASERSLRRRRTVRHLQKAEKM